MRWIPDAIVQDPPGFRDWARAAAQGERCLYHTGRIIVDLRTSPRVREMSEYATIMSSLGFLILNQIRVDDGVYQYVASRTIEPRSAMPVRVSSGGVSPRTYLALAAIKEGTPRLSLQRIVYYALGCSAQESVEILDQMEAEGLVEAVGKRRQITARGYEALR